MSSRVHRSSERRGTSLTPWSEERRGSRWNENLIPGLSQEVGGGPYPLSSSSCKPSHNVESGPTSDLVGPVWGTDLKSCTRVDWHSLWLVQDIDTRISFFVVGTVWNSVRDCTSNFPSIFFSWNSIKNFQPFLYLTPFYPFF